MDGDGDRDRDGDGDGHDHNNTEVHTLLVCGTVKSMIQFANSRDVCFPAKTKQKVMNCMNDGDGDGDGRSLTSTIRFASFRAVVASWFRATFRSFASLRDS